MTSLRATWVDRIRSVAEWKLPMFSARECRRAAEAALGANGSCTGTKSKGAVSSRGSTGTRREDTRRRVPASAQPRLEQLVDDVDLVDQGRDLDDATDGRRRVDERHMPPRSAEPAPRMKEEPERRGVDELQLSHVQH